MAVNTIPFGFVELVKDNGDESFDWLAGNIEARRIFWGDWDKRYDFLNTFLTYVLDADGNIVTAPQAYYPDIPSLMPLRATVKGKLLANNEGVNGMISFQKCLITVTYGLPPFGSNSGGVTQQNPVGQTYQPFLSVEGSLSSENIVIPGPFKIDDPNNPGNLLTLKGVNEIVLPHTKFEFSITQLYVPSPDWDLYYEKANNINTTNVYFPNGTAFAPGRLMYYGMTFHDKYLQDGTQMWEVSHKFCAKLNPNWKQRYTKNATTGMPELTNLPSGSVAIESDLNPILIQA